MRKTDEISKTEDFFGYAKRDRFDSASLHKSEDVYAGRFFYEIIRHSEGEIELNGPLSGIRYAVPAANPANDPVSESNKVTCFEYTFVQIKDGRPIQAYTDDEILVLNRRL